MTFKDHTVFSIFSICLLVKIGNHQGSFIIFILDINHRKKFKDVPTPVEAHVFDVANLRALCLLVYHTAVGYVGL